MFGYLFLLFTLVPLIELFFLIQIGAVIGAFNTIALVLITGALGAWMARTQGFFVLNRIQKDLATGMMPNDALFDGVMILVGGVLLITPGVFTDIFGFILLIPITRHWIKEYIKGKVKRQFDDGKTIRWVNYREY